MQSVLGVDQGKWGKEVQTVCVDGQFKHFPVKQREVFK